MGYLFDSLSCTAEKIRVGGCSLSSPRISSLVCTGDNRIAAATIGNGIYRQKDEQDWEWELLDTGFPEGAMTYRLQAEGGHLYASTDRGLFVWCGERWIAAGVSGACFKISNGGFMLAASENGVMQEEYQSWSTLAYPGVTCYDLLDTPNFLFVGSSRGIAYYDYLTGDWHEFKLKHAVTSLALFCNRLIGITTDGKLMVGNNNGGFTSISFGDNCFYKLIRHERETFICSNYGVYRLAMYQDRLLLKSLGLRLPATDAIVVKDRLYIATLHHGLINLPFTD